MSDLHPQDQLIVIEALTYWAHDLYETGDFDRNDPRRNRAAELVKELLESEDLPDGELSEIIDPEWSGPPSEG